MKEWLQLFAHISWIDGEKQRGDIWEITGYQVFPKETVIPSKISSDCQFV